LLFPLRRPSRHRATEQSSQALGPYTVPRCGASSFQCTFSALPDAKVVGVEVET